MTRFIIPAFFVVDCNSQEQAEAIANDMRITANDKSFPHCEGEHYCLFDERPTVTAELTDELPFTYPSR